MKYKKRRAKLEARQKDWDATMKGAWRNEPTGHKKPGSFNK